MFILKGNILIQEKYKKRLIDIIVNHFPEVTIYLFGSQAQNNTTQSSDIDIALDNNTPIENSLLNALRYEIDESTIPFFVDIIDLRSISADFYNHIKKDLCVWKK